MPFETKVDYNVKFDVVLLFVKAYPIKDRYMVHMFSDYYKKHKKIFDKRGYIKEKEYKGCNFAESSSILIIERNRLHITNAELMFGRKVVSCCKLKLKRRK